MRDSAYLFGLAASPESRKASRVPVAMKIGHRQQECGFPNEPLGEFPVSKLLVIILGKTLYSRDEMEPFFSYERGRGLDFKGFFTSKDCCFWCCLLENHLKIIGCIFRFHGQSENQTMFTDLSLPCSDLVRFKLSYKAIESKYVLTKGLTLHSY